MQGKGNSDVIHSAVVRSFSIEVFSTRVRLGFLSVREYSQKSSIFFNHKKRTKVDTITKEECFYYKWVG
jgi:hypothetical protein